LPDSDVYRFGGEEFLLVASFPSADDVGIAMDGLRRAIEDLDIIHADNLPWRRLTISLGVDIRDTRIPIDLEAWIRQADQALYRAKAAGRNRAFVIGPDGSEEVWAPDTIAADLSA
jgi:diguanylate cyclase (GGDEF)-like protein